MKEKIYYCTCVINSSLSSVNMKGYVTNAIPPYVSLFNDMVYYAQCITTMLYKIKQNSDLKSAKFRLKY